MKKNYIEISECIPALIKNTHLTVNLQGWPAAVALVALCSSGVVIYSLKVLSSLKEKTGCQALSLQGEAA